MHKENKVLKTKIPEVKGNIFLDIEKAMLKFWEENKIYEKAKQKNKNGKSFYFLDGPPYTSGRVHLGTAWNKSLKDMVLRYKRMQGFNVWDRAGYDMHGMPTEGAAQKELKLKNKDEILKYGMDKFVQYCKEFSIKNMKLMNKDFLRLGVWMDFDNAYYTISDDYIDGCWWLIKKAHENNRLYEGEKTMHWCATCGTALAKHELEYKTVAEESIFLKFPVIGSKNEYLIIWTTTPWTIPFNLGIMVNPELEYIKAKLDVNGKEEIWIVAKGLSAPFIQGVCNKRFTIIEEFKGEKLKGIKYRHPFHDLVKVYKEIEKKHPKAFSIVLSEEYVDLSAGTGLVHMAPGCGPEDYEIGHRNNIPPFNNLNEHGVFPEEMGTFKGFVAKKDDKKFVKALDELGSLIDTTTVEHEYAHCWRCHNPVIFRTTKQWFFKIEDLKETMRELNKSIYWVPEFAGSRSFDSWLSNLRDNGITRQRYWGTPLPVWKCQKCKNYIVIGSIEELKKKAGADKVKDLHKPAIDEITFRCEKEKCKGIMKREQDILDVWIDAGVSSWNCIYYPKNKDLFNKMYPPEFILEGIDQVRGWFNMLFVASMISMQKPSYKAVYMHGFINDALGRKMSKSLGNYILPEEVIDNYGSETLRYYMIGGTKPGVDINYNFEDMKVKFKNMGIIWNIHKFIIDLKKTNNLGIAKLDISKFTISEQYIFSKLNSTIAEVTELFEKYYINEIPWKIEELLMELSRTYIQLIRDKAAVGAKEEKQLILNVVYNVFMDAIKLLAPVCPLLTEQMYQNMRKEFSIKEESIHFHKWPAADKKIIDREVEKGFRIAKDLIQAVLSAREKAQLGVRWPLREVIVITDDKEVKSALSKLEAVIRTQTNIKKIVVANTFTKIKLRVKPNYKTLGQKYTTDVPIIIAHIMSENEHAILKKLESGEYSFTADKKKFSLNIDDLIIEREIPKEFVEAEFRNSKIYLDTSRTKELEAEGYAREVMRRIQMMRKNIGLEKKDIVNICITADKGLCSMLKTLEKEFIEKCGAKELFISEECKNFKHKEKIDIKGKQIEICVEVVND